MRNYNDEPKFESIGSGMYNLPFINEQGWEDSDIGIEIEPNGLIWFYDVSGLKKGINWKEAKVLGKQLLELAEMAKRYEQK